jgi:hypothetical protein
MGQTGRTERGLKELEPIYAWFLVVCCFGVPNFRDGMVSLTFILASTCLVRLCSAVADVYFA